MYMYVIYKYIYIYTRVYIHKYIYMNIDMYIYMLTHIHILIHTYISASLFKDPAGIPGGPPLNPTFWNKKNVSAPNNKYVGIGLSCVYVVLQVFTCWTI